MYFFMFICNSVFALLMEFSGLGQNKGYRMILVQHILTEPSTSIACP